MSDTIIKTGAGPVGQGGAHNRDDAWIEKYREAMQNAPVKKGRFDELRKKMEGLRKAIFANVKRISEKPTSVAVSAHKPASSQPKTEKTSVKKTVTRPTQTRVKKPGQRKVG